jgi:hypothetical protein
VSRRRGGSELWSESCLSALLRSHDASSFIGVTSVTSRITPTVLECFGGPLDGQRITERGAFFWTLETVGIIRDEVLVYPGVPAETYLRQADRYHWHPD